MYKKFIVTLLILGGIIIYSLIAEIFASNDEIISSLEVIEVSLLLIQRSCLIGLVSPSISGNIYGNITDPNVILKIEELIEMEPKFYDIFRCESKYNPEICNQEFGCIAGEGLGQVTPNTCQDCEIWLNRELDMKNPIDNLDCCKELYVRRKLIPWKQSEHCWGS